MGGKPGSDVTPAVGRETGPPTLSPCVGFCQLRADGVHCEGCLRTIDEIAAWSSASEAYKRSVRAALVERERRMRPSAG